MIMRRRTRRAATIIEVAMAMVILSVALPSLISSFIDASVQSITPSETTVASFLAIERMEEIVARRYRGIDGSGDDGYDALAPVSPSTPPAGFSDESPVSGFSRYSRTVRVAYMDYVGGALVEVGSDEGIKRVRVTVAWNGGARQLVMEHLFADYGSNE